MVSQSIENILYVGHNLALAETILNLCSSTHATANRHIDHIESIDEIVLSLMQHGYNYLVCELPISASLMNNIAGQYPDLKTHYLNPPQQLKKQKASLVTAELISEEVKTTLEYLSIPIYFKDRVGCFLACNSYFSNLFNLTPAEVIGKKASDFVSAPISHAIDKIDEKLFENNRTYLHEARIEGENNTFKDVVFRKETVNNGEVQIGIVFDVTEINKTKSLLDKERIMLRATANISTDLIFFKDLEGKFLGCNKQFEKFVGGTEQDIIGKNDEQLFKHNQAMMCQAQDQRVLTNNDVYIGEEYLTYNNGEDHFINMKKEALCDAAGNVQGLIGVGRDITANYLMKKRLNIADTVFQNSRDSIIVTDERGNIVSANKAVCITSGYSKDELLALNVKDFATKPYDVIQADLAMHNGWEGEISYSSKNGDINFVWLEVYVVQHGFEGAVNRIYSLTNLNQMEGIEKKIKYLAKLDPLTGLFNRIALFNRLDDAIKRAEYKEASLGVVLINLNGFKEVNEQYGHHIGDGVLIKVAERLKSCVFEKDTVARFSNHEFCIIVDELANEQNAAVIALQVAEQFNTALIVDGLGINLSAAIGIAMCPDDGFDADSLMDSAEFAVQRSRLDKGTSYHFYTPELTSHSKKQFELENELQEGLELDQFEIYYQPQYCLKTKQLIAIEALPRWQHPNRGLLTSDEFLVLAENSGLLVPIFQKGLYEVARQAVAWHHSGILFGRIVISLPLLQLEKSDFIADLQTVLLETKCANKWLEFAIDETIFINVSSIVRENLLNIKKMNISLIVDNYAADRPVLHLIEKLGIEKIKLSEHYNKETPTSYINTAVISALSLLGKSLGVDIVGNLQREDSEVESCSNVNNSSVLAQNKAMKASEATFYLRCNKRK